mmetsp:Transcript_11076/g.68193  ORF Transcript_11076/g.68193 Transcript_11076/m.68193 type:complete len:219 (+) Transcript_11076:1866-2522(+)
MMDPGVSTLLSISLPVSDPNLKSPGFSNNGSALSTPCAPVKAIKACASAKLRTPPFASKGILMASRTARMALQSGGYSFARFMSRVRPCTAIIEHPASSSIRAYASVNFKSSKTLILAVTGTLSLATTCRTMATTLSRWSIKKAPYFPLLAIRWGQPRFKSTPSTNGATASAASSQILLSLAQNCARRGRSSASTLVLFSVVGASLDLPMRVVNTSAL